MSGAGLISIANSKYELCSCHFQLYKHGRLRERDEKKKSVHPSSKSSKPHLTLSTESSASHSNKHGNKKEKGKKRVGLVMLNQNKNTRKTYQREKWKTLVIKQKWRTTLDYRFHKHTIFVHHQLSSTTENRKKRNKAETRFMTIWVPKPLLISTP